jgi:hypothetical protein
MLENDLSFESLVERYQFRLPGFPERWLPLTYLYDPDLPLFPIYYFHVLDPSLGSGQRPGTSDRAYGFVETVVVDGKDAVITVACNKDLGLSQYASLAEQVRVEVSERLGIGNPVTLSDIEGCLSGRMSGANSVTKELWYKVVDSAFGKKLPFGRIFDQVFGLPRFIASWNSDGGRKGELIQTHDFVRQFGIRIPTGRGIHADFYLLPTYSEFRDLTNPLSLFPRLADLLDGVKAFRTKYCTPLTVGTLTLSKFSMAATGASGMLNQAKYLDSLKALTTQQRADLIGLFGSFNRGPQRSVLAIMMIYDLRNGGWDPVGLSRVDAAKLYTGMDRSYQSPKVMHLYAQLCFGNQAVLPIDNWIQTLLRWPLAFGKLRSDSDYQELFTDCAVWGKVERLLWTAAQARKVHASVCESILWCIRYGDAEGSMRGAGPLSCNICEPRFRESCAAYRAVASSKVSFNGVSVGTEFLIQTSAGNSVTGGQTFAVCEGVGISTRGQRDEYSANDKPGGFSPFPAPGHVGGALTVKEFIDKY